MQQLLDWIVDERRCELITGTTHAIEHHRKLRLLAVVGRVRDSEGDV